MESANRPASTLTTQVTGNTDDTGLAVQVAAADDTSTKPADGRVFVQVHTTDVEAIRAVLALKSPKRRGFPGFVWIGVALALLVAVFAAWQWTVSAVQAAESVTPPQMAAPKPPDFAFVTSDPAPPTQPERSKAHSHRGRMRTGAGN
ncbi:MAG: hypothetical protein WA734_13690 [Candidatus Acidiferrales bacterium]